HRARRRHRACAERSPSHSLCSFIACKHREKGRDSLSRILIVDDEINMRRILAANLMADRHTITEASGVEEATAHLTANRFDAVITDQKMPDGEGLDLLARA